MASGGMHTLQQQAGKARQPTAAVQICFWVLLQLQFVSMGSCELAQC